MPSLLFEFRLLGPTDTRRRSRSRFARPLAPAPAVRLGDAGLGRTIQPQPKLFSVKLSFANTVRAVTKNSVERWLPRRAVASELDCVVPGWSSFYGLVSS